MSPKVQNGTVIFRRWSKRTGLDETAVSFLSLDDLFSLCLQGDDALLVDRVLIEGHDTSGTRRTVTLTFQSVTVGERTTHEE